MSLLLKFIETGNLADIKLGLQGSAVRAKVGSPTDIMDLSDSLTLWAYGYGLELYFENSLLSKISIKYDFTLGKFRLPECFVEEIYGQFDRLSSVDNLIELLKEQEIDWSIDKRFSDDSTICLLCNEISCIYYSLEDHHILCIQSASS